MRTIETVVEKVIADSTGRFRFVLTMEGVRFFSQPMSKAGLLEKFADMCDHPELTSLEYESKTEYTPGNHVWTTF